MNNRFRIALAVFGLIASGSINAMIGDVARRGDVVRPQIAFGVSVVDDANRSHITYNLVDLNQNQGLTPGLRAELEAIKKDYQSAVSMTREYFKGKLVGTGYKNAEGKVVGYTLTYN